MGDFCACEGNPMIIPKVINPKINIKKHAFLIYSPSPLINPIAYLYPIHPLKTRENGDAVSLFFSVIEIQGDISFREQVGQLKKI